MLNRSVVSFFAFLATILSVTLFALSAWWAMTGRINEIDAVFMTGGWLLAAILFGSRSADAAYLEPLSIVKGR